LGSIAIKGGNGQTSAVAVAIRHDLQERTARATRIPGHTACFREFLGHSFDLILSHPRFPSAPVKNTQDTSLLADAVSTKVGQ
jgi:hypothetical protein